MDLMKIDIPLVVVGKKTAYMNFLKIQIKKLNFDPNKIIFLDDVSMNELPIIYKLSSLFVYPSIFEGFGIPILEALFSKTPVVTSKGGCFSEAGGSESIYINPLSIKEIKNAILKIQKNLGLQKKMKEIVVNVAILLDKLLLNKSINNRRQKIIKNSKKNLGNCLIRFEYFKLFL